MFQIQLFLIDYNQKRGPKEHKYDQQPKKAAKVKLADN